MNGDNEFYRLLFEHADAAVLVLDPGDLGIRWESPAARRLFDGAKGPLPDLVAVDDAPVVGTFLQAARANGSSRCTCAIPVDGTTDRRVDLVARDLTSVPEVAGLVVVALDVTSWAERSRKLAMRLNTDTMTGLANWTGFRPRLEQATRGAPASGPGPVLVFLDLNHFKIVNDRHGHAVGDEVLKRVASLLGAVITGRGTAARVGGDEFALLIDQASEQEALDIAGEVLTAISAPLTLTRGLVVRITASAGIAFARPGTKPKHVLRQADLAMYRAKITGPGTAVVYREELADWMLVRKHQVTQLAHRLEQLHQENQALAEAATIDQRTGLPNAAAFDADHAGLNSEGTPYSLLLVDVDHFHSYNTVYRYLAGHRALREVAQTIKETVRGSDRSYRYGGEEFTVLLPGTRLRDAMVVAERIRHAVERLGIEHQGNPSGVVTVCVGVVEAGCGTTVTEAVEAASVAVLRAKDMGRNRVTGEVCWSDNGSASSGDSPPPQD